MEVNLITEGLKFMLLGMTTVFLFLLLLIFVLKLQAKIIGKYFPDKESTPTKKPTVPAVSTTNNDEAQVIAAITAAITDFKKK